MTREIIDKAIKTDGIVEMEYSKDGVSNKYYQLDKIAYSDLPNCFSGYPIGSDMELTFNINKVKEIQLMWDFVFDENIRLVKVASMSYHSWGTITWNLASTAMIAVIVY